MAKPVLAIAAPAPEPAVVGQVLAIPLADIDVRDRLRPVDATWAKGLAGIMAQDGYNQTPIEVCRLRGRSGYLLVTGGHRMAAAALNGWAHIRAVIVEGDVMDRRLREVSENLWRRDLDPIDRAAFVAELYMLLRARDGVAPETTPQQVAIQARWKKELKKQASDTAEMISAVYGWTAEVGQWVGLTDRTIRLDLALHRGLSPAVVTQLRGHPISRNAAQLQALAKMADADQRAVTALIIDGKAKGANEALGLLRQKPKPDPEKKAWSAFFGGWSRMSARRRREALRELADQGLPSGVRIVFDREQ